MTDREELQQAKQTALKVGSKIGLFIGIQSKTSKGEWTFRWEAEDVSGFTNALISKGRLMDYIDLLALEVWEWRTEFRAVYGRVESKLLEASSLPPEGYQVLGTGCAVFTAHAAVKELLCRVEEEVLHTSDANYWMYEPGSPPRVRREKNPN